MLLQQALGLLFLIWAIMHLQGWPITEERTAFSLLLSAKAAGKVYTSPVLS